MSVQESFEEIHADTERFLFHFYDEYNAEFVPSDLDDTKQVLQLNPRRLLVSSLSTHDECRLTRIGIFHSFVPFGTVQTYAHRLEESS